MQCSGGGMVGAGIANDYSATDCSAPGCAGCARIAALHVFWDVENAAVPRGGSVTAADVATALLAAARRLAHEPPAAAATAAAAAAGPGLVAVAPHRYPSPLRKSLQLAGVAMCDAGDKRGAVDIALKDLVNDVIIDFASHSQADVAGGAETWLVIVSGDGDFAGDLRRARRVGLRVGLVHSASSPAELARLADRSLPWSAVLEAAEQRRRGAPGSPRDGAADGGEAPSGATAVASAGVAAAGSGDAPGIAVPQSPVPLAPQPRPRAPSSSAELCRDHLNGRCARRACRYVHASPAVIAAAIAAEQLAGEAAAESPPTAAPTAAATAAATEVATSAEATAAAESSASTFTASVPAAAKQAA